MDKQWSPKEKNAARQIFNLAVANAQKDMTRRHSQKTITTLDELWRYELEIREWRREVQTTLLFTYSRLAICFAHCLQKGWLTESNLEGLCAERLEQINGVASFKRK